MDFTREPIIETIITPKEGCKLVIRSSKGAGQEEYFVDAVEIVTLGYAHFFRSLERPKSFLVPVADYEVVEVREARMVLKTLGPDRSIKIGGGRESLLKTNRESEKPVIQPQEEEVGLIQQEEPQEQPTSELKTDTRLDKKRDRRKHYRKRRNGKDELIKDENFEIGALPPLEEEGKVAISPPEEDVTKGEEINAPPMASQLLLLQPPPLLISETINRYRDMFKNAFFLPEDEQYRPHNKVEELLNEDEEDFAYQLKEPIYESHQESSESESESDDQENSEMQEIIQTEESVETHNSMHEQDLSEGKEISEHVIENESYEAPSEQTFTYDTEENLVETSLPLFAEESFDEVKEDEETLFVDESLLKNSENRDHSHNNSLPSE